jgi:cell division septal protein FtsQ
LQLLTYALRLMKPGLSFLSPVARGPQRRSRMIGKSTQLTEEIAKIAGITSSSLRIRKRRAISITLTMQRSGARSIVPQDTI